MQRHKLVCTWFPFTIICTYVRPIDKHSWHFTLTNMINHRSIKMFSNKKKQQNWKRHQKRRGKQQSNKNDELKCIRKLIYMLHKNVNRTTSGEREREKRNKTVTACVIMKTSYFKMKMKPINNRLEWEFNKRKIQNQKNYVGFEYTSRKGKQFRCEKVFSFSCQWIFFSRGVSLALRKSTVSSLPKSKEKTSLLAGTT